MSSQAQTAGWSEERSAHLATTAILFRCKAPTDRICPCGKVARKLRAGGVDYEQRRVPLSKTKRPEIVRLTGQRFVPVLIHGDEVVHDSARIIAYLDRLTP